MNLKGLPQNAYRPVSRNNNNKTIRSGIAEVSVSSSVGYKVKKNNVIYHFRFHKFIRSIVKWLHENLEDRANDWRWINEVVWLPRTPSRKTKWQLSHISHVSSCHDHLILVSWTRVMVAHDRNIKAYTVGLRFSQSELYSVLAFLLIVWTNARDIFTRMGYRCIQG